MAKSLPVDHPAAEICALCLLGFEKLARSHVVPDYHYKRMKSEEGRFFQISGTGKLEKPIQTGLYERLLCEHCEAHLNDGFENEVHKLFELGAFDPKGIGLQQDFIVPADYRTLRLYMLSILWRASVAARPPFDEFVLEASCEEYLRQSLLFLTPPPPSVLPFVVLTIEFDGGWTNEWASMPQHGLAGEMRTAFFVVGGLLICFFLSPVKPDRELLSMLVKYDGLQRVRRMHVNHVEGLSRSVELIANRYREAETEGWISRFKEASP